MDEIIEKIKELLKNPTVVGVLCLVLGLFIGWFVIGWGLWPVQWADAEPRHLRADLQTDYMRQVIESYALNGDVSLAIRSYEGLGETKESVLADVKSKGLVTDAQMENFEMLLAYQSGEKEAPEVEAETGEEVAEEPAAEEMPAEETTGEEVIAEEPETEPADEEDAGKRTSFLGVFLGVLCVLLLVVAGGLVYLNFFKGGNRLGAGKKEFEETPPTMGSDVQTPTAEVDMEEPSDVYLRQLVSEYAFGNDIYDDSFSIDAPTGEFLGEFGVGISDTIGNEEPKRVSAFEVWLFDKEDVQTVTKVLMTEYAMSDPDTIQRLEMKGEPVLIAPDKVVTLATATMELEARILDVVYGQGDHEDEIFVQSMKVELTVWPR
ncbi:MAG: hypothetical protein JW750_12940 [Anaerolineaceae bacterium]|nr:hypothetical protein [Anaerolineaceae bacterium]